MKKKLVIVGVLVGLVATCLCGCSNTRAVIEYSGYGNFDYSHGKVWIDAGYDVDGCNVDYDNGVVTIKLKKR